jgi:hypothetical protein
MLPVVPGKPFATSLIPSCLALVYFALRADGVDGRHELSSQPLRIPATRSHL